MTVNVPNKVLVYSCWFIFLSLCLAMTSNPCMAQEGSRMRKSEFFVLGQSMGGDKTTGTFAGLKSTLALDNTIVGGLGYGFNVNDNVNINTDWYFGSTDITGRVSGVTLRGDTRLLGWDLNLDINFLKTRFTPLLTGGIGFINFNGSWNSAVGNEDFSETDFSYNLGGGLRWDVSDHFVVKALYKATWTKLKYTDDNIMLDGVSLSVGYVF